MPVFNFPVPVISPGLNPGENYSGQFFYSKIVLSSPADRQPEGMIYLPDTYLYGNLPVFSGAKYIMFAEPDNGLAPIDRR
jgi:hypothetical protein